MANNIIFTDGFDHYTTLLDKWDAVLGFQVPGQSVTFALPSIVAGAGRGGAGAVSIGPMSQGGFGNTQYEVIVKNIGAQPTLYVGFAFYWNPATMNTDMEVLRFIDGSTAQLSLWINASGILYLNRGDTTATLATSSTAFPANSYHYIELRVTINSTTGAYELRIDQSTVFSGTGANTRVTANNFFTTIWMGQTSFVAGGSGYVGYIDDVYFDTLDFNGDNRINGQLPSGDGSTQNFTNVAAGWVLSTATPLQTTIVDSNGNLQRCVANTGDTLTGSGAHPTWSTTVGVNTTDNHVTWICLTTGGTYSQYLLVNETNPDGNSSYIQSNTVNDISRFTYPSVPGTAIRAVMIWAFAKKDDGGFRTIQGSVKSGATVGTTGVDVPLGGNYQYLLLQSLTDPNTSAAWTVSGVNAAEFGIKITN